MVVCLFVHTSVRLIRKRANRAVQIRAWCSVICQFLDFWTRGAESINYDYSNRKRRQDIEVKYLENGSFYIVSPEALVKNKNRLGGYVGFYEQEKYKMYQIDNIGDVALCEAILNGYGLND